MHAIFFFFPLQHILLWHFTLNLRFSVCNKMLVVIYFSQTSFMFNLHAAFVSRTWLAFHPQHKHCISNVQTNDEKTLGGQNEDSFASVPLSKCFVVRAF